MAENPRHDDEPFEEPARAPRKTTPADRDDQDVRVHVLGMYLIVAALIIVVGIWGVNQSNIRLGQEAAKRAQQTLGLPLVP